MFDFDFTQSVMDRGGGVFTYTFTITPNRTLTEDIDLTWSILQQGFLPIPSSYFSSMTGMVSFAMDDDASDGQDVEIRFTSDPETSFPRNFAIEVTDSDGAEVTTGDVTIRADDSESDATQVDFIGTGAKNVLGAITSIDGDYDAGGDNDEYVITRYQHGDVEILDRLGTNTIKFDYGVTITAYRENGNPVFGIGSIELTLSTRAKVKINTPDATDGTDGPPFFSYQFGDGTVMSYAQLKTTLGITQQNTDVTLTTPFEVTTASPVATGVTKGTTAADIVGSTSTDILGAGSDAPLDLDAGSGDDVYVITRHQVGDTEILDRLGTNTIKFDFGVSITAYRENGNPVFGIGSIELILSTSAKVKINTPDATDGTDGPPFFSYQFGDGMVMSYAQLKTTLGITQQNTDVMLDTPFTVPFPGDTTPPPVGMDTAIGASPDSISINDNTDSDNPDPSFDSGDGTGKFFLADDASGKTVTFSIEGQTVTTSDDEAFIDGRQFNAKVEVTDNEGTNYGTLFFFGSATHNAQDGRYETNYAFRINNEGVNSRAVADGDFTIPITVNASVNSVPVAESDRLTFNIVITPGDDATEFDTTTSPYSAEGMVTEDDDTTNISEIKIGFSDPDTDVSTITLTATAAEGGATDTIDADGSEASVKTDYGTFTFTREHETDNRSGTITWNYTLGVTTLNPDGTIEFEAVDKIPFDTTAEDRITIADSNGKETIITVRIAGRDDPITFSVDTGEDSGSLTEDAITPNNEATGTIYFNDPDATTILNANRTLTASVSTTLPDTTTFTNNNQLITSSVTTAYGSIDFTRTDSSDGRGSSIVWTYTLDNSKDDILPIGDHTETITLAIDGTSVEQDIVITVTGSDDLLTFDSTGSGRSASGAVEEDISLNTASNQTIGFSDADTDITGITLRATATQGGNAEDLDDGTEAVIETDYGTFRITRNDAAGTITWNYELDQGPGLLVNTIAAGGAPQPDEITIANTADTARNVVIRVDITGTDDPAVFDTSDSTLYEGSVEEGVTASVTKTITFNDPDNPNVDIANLKAYVTLDGGESSADIAPNASDGLDGKYGRLSFTRTDGDASSSIVWTYTLNNEVPAAATGETFTLRFGDDGDEVDIAITITAHETETMFTTSGTEDGTTFSNVGMLTEDDSTTMTEGIIGFSDPDSETLMLTVGEDTVDIVADREVITSYGKFTFTSRDDTNGRLNWRYELDNMADATDGLPGDQMEQDQITIKSSGGGGTTITIDLTGAEDPMEFDATSFGTSAAGSVTESIREVPNADDIIAGRTIGRIFFIDPDTDLSTIALNISGAQYGTLSIIERNDRTGELVWQYELQNSHTDVDRLDGLLPSAPTGEIEPRSITDRISITGPGGVRQEIAITITGANDTPRVSSDSVLSATITEDIGATITTNFNTVYQRLNDTPYVISFSDPDTSNVDSPAALNEFITITVNDARSIVPGQSDDLFGSGKTDGIFIPTTYGLIKVFRTNIKDVNGFDTGTGTLEWTYYLRHGVIEDGVLKRDTILDVGSEAVPTVTDSIFLSISDKNSGRGDFPYDHPNFQDTIDITITGINDNPTLTQGGSQRPLPADTPISNYNTGITFTATDPDRDTVFTTESFVVHQGRNNRRSTEYKVIDTNPDGEPIWTLVFSGRATGMHMVDVLVMDELGAESNEIIDIPITFGGTTRPVFRDQRGLPLTEDVNLQSTSGTMNFSDDVTPRADLIIRIDDGTAEGVTDVDLSTIPSRIDISAYGNTNYGKFELTMRDNNESGDSGRLFWRYTLDERAQALALDETVTESVSLFVQDANDERTTASIIVNVTGTNDAPRITLLNSATTIRENIRTYFESDTDIRATITDVDTDRDDLTLRVYEVDSEGVRTISNRFELVRDIYYSRNPGENDYIVVIKPSSERKRNIFNHEDPYNTGTLDHDLNGVFNLELEVEDQAGAVVASTETISVTITDIFENTIANPAVSQLQLNKTFAEGEEINFVFREDAFIDDDETNPAVTIQYSAEFLGAYDFTIGEVGQSAEEWLRFDPTTRTFSGTGTQEQSDTSFKIRVLRMETRDDNGSLYFIHRDFFITITDTDTLPLLPQGADAPSLSITIAEPDPETATQTTATITRDQLRFADGDTPTVAGIRYVLEDAPGQAGVELQVDRGSGFVTLATGETFTQQDINDNNVRLVKDGTEPTDATDSFTFFVDNKTSGAADPNATEQTFNITVTAFNDPFMITNISQIPSTRPSVNEDGSLAITDAHLSVTDEEQTDTTLIIYTITASPVNGTLRINGTPVPADLTSNNTFTQADLVAGDRIVYTPNNDADNKDVRSDEFSFTIGDSLGNAESATQTFRIDIANNVPEPPVISLFDNNDVEIDQTQPITHSINEDRVAGNIGISLEAFDPDIGETLGASSFTVYEGSQRISASTRFGVVLESDKLQLQLLDGAEINHENPLNGVSLDHGLNGRLDLGIVLTDGTTTPDDVTIQLTIDDVHEAPSVEFTDMDGDPTTSGTLSESAPDETAITGLTITASDEDENDILAATHFQVLEGGSTSTRFEVTSAGANTYNLVYAPGRFLGTRLDYETDADRIVNLTIRVTDPGGQVAVSEFDITVNLTDANDNDLIFDTAGTHSATARIDEDATDPRIADDQTIGYSDADSTAIVGDVDFTATEDTRDSGDPTSSPVTFDSTGGMIETEYGTFHFTRTNADMNNGTLTWWYVLDSDSAEVKGIAEGASPTDRVTLSAPNATSIDLVVTITGVNNSPMMEAKDGNANGDFNEFDTTASGIEDTGIRLVVTDDDNDVSALASSAFMIAKANASHNDPGAFEVRSLGNGEYRLVALKSTAVDYDSLNADQRSIELDITVNDGSVNNAVSMATRVTVAVNPLDDEILTYDTGGTYSASGEIQEDADPNSVVGTIGFTDLDTQTLTFSASAGSETLDNITSGSLTTIYGSVTFRIVNNNEIEWTYRILNNEAIVQGLNAGDRIPDNFTITSTHDNQPQEISITAIGADDLPDFAGGIAFNPTSPEIGTAYEYMIPEGSFTDADDGEDPEVGSISGGPSWLRFDRATQTFSSTGSSDGNVPSNAENFTVTLNLVDKTNPGVAGNSVMLSFTVIGEGNRAPQFEDQNDAAYRLNTNEDALNDESDSMTITFEDEDGLETGVTIKAIEHDSDEVTITDGATAMGQYGTFTFTRSNSEGNANIGWTYTLTTNLEHLGTHSTDLMDNLRLTITDGDDAGQERTIFVTIAGVNNPPTANPVDNFAVNTKTSRGLTADLFRAEDVDLDTASNEDITFIIKSGPTHGEIQIAGSEVSRFTLTQLTNNEVSYMSDSTTPDDVASDSFSFALTDGSGDETTQQSFTININQRPGIVVAATDSEVEEDSETGNTTANGTITLSDVNSGDTLVFTAGSEQIEIVSGEQDVDGRYGTFYFTRTTRNDVTWRYELDNDAVQPVTSTGDFDVLAVSVSDLGINSVYDGGVGDDLSIGDQIQITILGKNEVKPVLSLGDPSQSEIELAALGATAQQDLGVTFTVTEVTPTEDDFEVFEGDPATTSESKRFDVRNDNGVWTLELDSLLEGFDAPDGGEVIELQIQVRGVEEASDPVTVRVTVTGRDTGDAVYVLSTNANMHEAPVSRDLKTDGTPTENTTLYAFRPSDGDDPDGYRTQPSYEWQRVAPDLTSTVILNDADGDGTDDNSSSYTLKAADAGHRIQAVVTYEDGVGTDESVTTDGVIPPADSDATFALFRFPDFEFTNTIYVDNNRRIEGETFATTHSDEDVTFRVTSMRDGRFHTPLNSFLSEYTHAVNLGHGWLHYHNKDGDTLLILQNSADNDPPHSTTATLTVTRADGTTTRQQDFSVHKTQDRTPLLQDTVITFTDTEMNDGRAEIEGVFELIDGDGNSLTPDSTRDFGEGIINGLDSLEVFATYTDDGSPEEDYAYFHYLRFDGPDGNSRAGEIHYKPSDGTYLVRLSQAGLNLLNKLPGVPEGQDPSERLSVPSIFNVRIGGNDLQGRNIGDLTVRLEGANDAPILANAVADASYFIGTGSQRISVDRVFWDVDTGDSLTFVREYEQSPGVWVGFDSLPTGFSFASGHLVIDTDTATVSDYTFRITATDSHGLSADAPDEFTITLEDSFTVTPISTTYTDTAGDDIFAPIAGVMLYHGTALGEFSVTGMEGSQTLTAETITSAEFGFGVYSHKIVGTYGTLYYDERNINNYIFAPNDAAIESLKSGQVTSTYTFAHTGTTQTQDITITVTGANDAPEVAVSTDENGNIIDRTVEEYSSEIIIVPNNIFFDRDDANLTISYQVLNSQGNVIREQDEPTWLTFGLIKEAGKQTQYGFTIQNPTRIAEDTDYTIRLTAEDPQGATANADIALTITNQDRPAGANHNAIYVISTSLTKQAIPTASDLESGDILHAYLLEQDPDGDVSNATYKWFLDGVALAPGIIPSSYRIADDDLGKSLSVEVTYTETGGVERVVTTEAVYIPDPSAFGVIFSASEHVREAQTHAGATTTTEITLFFPPSTFLTIPATAKTASGTISIVDPANDFGSLVITLNNGGVTDYGSFVITNRDDRAGTLSWQYTLNDDSTATNALEERETVNDSISITFTRGALTNTVEAPLVTVVGANDAPVPADDFASHVDIGARLVVGAMTGFRIADTAFIDPEGDDITYSLVGAPAWLTYNATYDEFIVNNPTTTGDTDITIRATDSRGAYTESTLTLEIIATTGQNRPELEDPQPDFSNVVDFPGDNEVILIPEQVVIPDTLTVIPGESDTIVVYNARFDAENIDDLTALTPDTNARFPGFEVYNHASGDLYYDPTDHSYFYFPDFEDTTGGEDVFVIYKNANDVETAKTQIRAVIEFLRENPDSENTPPRTLFPETLTFSTEEGVYYDELSPTGTFMADDADDPNAVIQFNVTVVDASDNDNVIARSVVDTRYGFTHSVEGQYGRILYHRDGGKWVYVYDDRAESGVAGETLTDVFTVVAVDETGYASAPQTLTMTITSGEDRPELAGGSAGRVGNRPIDANDRATRSGTIEISNLTDRDADDAAAIRDEFGYIRTDFWTADNDFSLQAQDADDIWQDVTDAAIFSVDLTYGSFMLSHLGKWTYTLGTTTEQKASLAAIDFEDTAEEALTIRFKDTDGGADLFSNEATVIATINGVNKLAQFAAATGLEEVVVVTPTITDVVGPTDTPFGEPGDGFTRLTRTTTTTTTDMASYTYNSGTEDQVIVEVSTTAISKEQIFVIDYTDPGTIDFMNPLGIGVTEVNTFAVTGSVTKNNDTNDSEEGIQTEISGTLSFGDIDGFNGVTDNSHIAIRVGGEFEDGVLMGHTTINQGTNDAIKTTYGDITFTRANDTGLLTWTYALNYTEQHQDIIDLTTGMLDDDTITLRITDGDQAPIPGTGGRYTPPDLGDAYGTDATITITVNAPPAEGTNVIEPDDDSEPLTLYEQDPFDATRTGTLEFIDRTGTKIAGADVNWGMTPGEAPGVYTTTLGGKLTIIDGSYTYERPTTASLNTESGGAFNSDDEDITDSFTIMAHESGKTGNSITDTLEFTIKGLSDVNGSGAVDNQLNGADDTDELIQGGNLGDTIDTKSGRDVVVGGYGNDAITLGAGEKTVIHRFASLDGANAWRNDDGRDTIKAFKHGEDKLVLVDTDTGSAIGLTDLVSDTSASSGFSLKALIDEDNDTITGFEIGFGATLGEDGSVDGSASETGRFFVVQYTTAIAVFAQGSSESNPIFTDDAKKLLGDDGTSVDRDSRVLNDHSLIPNYFGDDNLDVIPLSDLDITIL